MIEASDTRFARRVIAALSVFVCVAVATAVYGPAASGTLGQGPSTLATLNALLNATSAFLLVCGYVAIRKRNIVVHRACMVSAFSVSALFLVTYLVHHAQVGSVRFPHQGALRVVYFSLLIPHIVLAAVIIPLALFTIYRGWTQRLEAHRRVARWTLPLWLFVSSSGVIIYWMLYHL